MLVLLTGGARAGKSRIAEERAAAIGGPVTVIATAEASDREMAARIAAHKAARPDHWALIEESTDIAGAIAQPAPTDTVIVDCLTLWVNNLMGKTDDQILEQAHRFAESAVRRDATTYVITNEVGDGIVPVNALARRYRDTLGRVNQIVSRAADQAYLVVAGRVVSLQGASDV